MKGRWGDGEMEKREKREIVNGMTEWRNAGVKNLLSD